jgi:hypothetical protein
MPFKVTIVEIPAVPVAAGDELPMPIEILSVRLDTIDIPFVIQTLTKKPRAKRSDAGKRKPAVES